MDTAQSPLRVVFLKKRTDLPVITSSPPVPILHDCLHAADTPISESASNVLSFLHSPYKVAVARSLRGKEAQGLIDLIDQVGSTHLHSIVTHLDTRKTEHEIQVIALPELDQKLRKQCLHLLYKMCKACETLPASYVLQQESLCVGNLHCYGGFADVSEGEYLGRRVAIKHLRIARKDASNKIFKVLNFSLTQYLIVT